MQKIKFITKRSINLMCMSNVQNFYVFLFCLFQSLDMDMMNIETFDPDVQISDGLLGDFSELLHNHTLNTETFDPDAQIYDVLLGLF